MYVYWGKLNGVIKQSRDKAPTVPLSSPNKGYSSLEWYKSTQFSLP